MRRIIVGTFLSLDGVMQAPGGPEEDRTGQFEYGGWTVPYWDDVVAGAMGESFSKPFDLLLGRRTYDIFAAHWPHQVTDPNDPGFVSGEGEIAKMFNDATKYVATHRPESLNWQNSELLGDDIIASLRAIKATEGPDLSVSGSSELVHQLLASDLVDELRLLIYPVILGKGKRLFDGQSVPSAFKLVSSTTSPSGVIIANYQRSGELKTGSFAMDHPSEEEIERRKNLS
ncbi:dihydrofolate reductase family protein [Brucella anthropi]|uniref:dihydrofolate reductase family protein n=1 Tax=Brucella anthropi TaxID=529 RepID=UPI00124C497F|nr:dihydrofolate reductase family protein [Brucella anthropi]KAB2752533.1 dihydrofolate reductase family protein [Brucella anthropi]MDH0368439.1 dihydrofolate reductase family protein [Brucella anthropi]